MLSASDRLDEATLLAVLRSGHSRIPVHAAGDRGEVVGLVLVKELLQYRLGSSGPVPVGMLRMRSIPRCVGGWGWGWGVEAGGGGKTGGGFGGVGGGSAGLYPHC